MNVFGLDDAGTRALLDAGIRAPSADNAHLFRYRISPVCIEISGTQAYIIAPPQRRLLTWISLGAVAENICIAASALGLQLDVAWPFSDEAICKLTAVSDRADRDPLEGAISTRHTNRRLNFGPPLTEDERKRLEQQVGVVEATRLVWLDGADVRRAAARLMYMAERERFRRPELHHELFSSLRFDLSRDEPCTRGIPIAATEIDPIARAAFSLMRHWPFMRLLNAVGGDRIAALRAAYLPARFASNLALLLAEGGIEFAAVRTGRAMQRLWLQATLMQGSIQPMAAGALYSRAQFEAVSPRVRQALAAGWQQLAGEKGAPLMILRIGYAKPPSVRSARPPLQSFLEP